MDGVLGSFERHSGIPQRLTYVDATGLALPVGNDFDAIKRSRARRRA